jgi:hypothetical protein
MLILSAVANLIVFFAKQVFDDTMQLGIPWGISAIRMTRE